MTLLNRITLTCLITLLFIKGHSQTTEECKYLYVLNYVRTNPQIIKDVKFTFPKLTKKKENFIDFKISSLIYFLGLEYVKLEMTDKGWTIGKQTVNDSTIRLYRENHFFERFRSTFLMKLDENNNAKLYLAFSKPVDNYLMIEFRNLEPTGSREFGKAAVFLLKFDEFGFIENFLFSVQNYN